MTYTSTMICGSRLAYWRAVVPGPGRSTSLDPALAGTVLLVHGLGADYRGLMPLAQTWPHAEVIAPDLPGFGQSEPLRAEHSMTNYARVLEALCAHLRVSNLIVVGHSLGADIALAFAAQYPQRVRASVLICPVTGTTGPQAWLARAYYRVGTLLPAPVARLWFLSRAAVYLGDHSMLTTTNRVTRRRILDEDYRTAALASPHTIPEIYRSLVRTPFTAIAATVRTPSLLIAAERDSLASPRTVAALHDHLQLSKLVVVPAAGHLWPVEEPAAAGHLIAESLRAADVR
jgi:pimeloyl-ACP methyl ester carboxylesterase